MDKNQQIKSNEDLNWFWKLTTKWWYFPFMHLFLALVALRLKFLFKENIGVNLNFFDILYFMSLALPVILSVIPGTATFLLFLLFLFYIIVLFSSSIIYYYKVKHQKILKWVIFGIFLLLICHYNNFWAY